MVKRESHSSDHLTGGSHRRVITTKLATAIAAFFLLASIAVIIAIATVQVKRRTYASPGLKYGIVLDAGSSRTTVYLYHWPAEKENNTGVVNETAKCQVKGPGISDMDSEAWKNLKKCMESIMDNIPVHQRNSTPVYLGATAGMRLLHEKSEERSHAVLGNITEYLRSLPLDFHNASIISGHEEGLYGWITVNYLLGNFVEKNIWNAWVRPHGTQTVGSLDLGGASTQIAFTVPLDARGQDFIKVSLYGYEYNVYTHSFLCYGRNEAEKRVLAELVKSAGSLRIKHPCYPLGYIFNKSEESIFSSWCTNKIVPSNPNPKKNYTFIGQSNPVQCKTLVKRIFDLKSCEASENCSFNGVNQPPVTGDFMAYAGFYYTADALKLSGTNSLEKFNSTMWSFCSMDWETLKKTYNSTLGKHLNSYCFSANYIHTLLADGYKFNADNWKQLDFQKEVKSTSIAWSLGYMLAQSNMIPAEAKLLKLPISNSVFTTVLFLFSAITIITLIFLIITLVRVFY